MSFWQNLQKPIIGLAPMDGVTDVAYRSTMAKFGKPDVIVTEFIPVEGIIRLSERLMKDFWYTSVERPVVAQIYGNEPELFYASAQLVCELGFDGVDINMGCPAKSVVHRGCGAALINTPELAQELVRTVQQAVKDWQENGINWEKWPAISGVKAKRLLEEFISQSRALGAYDDWEVRHEGPRRLVPVTVKTRVGFNEPVVDSWIPKLLETKPEVIAIHGRTLKQKYNGSADWGLIGEAVTIRNELSPETLVLGNGDVKTAADAQEKIASTGVDGVLVGRATYGNPWLLAEIKTGSAFKPQSLEELFNAMSTHAHLHEQFKPGQAFAQMRKNLAWYITSIPGAAQLRSQLVRVSSAAEADRILSQYLQTTQSGIEQNQGE